jgi:hypothetical protein
MFSTFLGSSNRVMIGNSAIASQNEFYIAGLSFAQTVIDEAKVKDFSDDPLSGKGSKVINVSGLGPDVSGEVVNGADASGGAGQGFKSQRQFDDVDDYNGYSRTINSDRAEGYNISCLVQFVSETNPNTVSVLPTNAKKMTVLVTSKYFPRLTKNGVEKQDTLKLTYVFSNTVQ